MSWQLQSEGWGPVVGERRYAGGILDGEADPRPDREELVLLLAPERRAALPSRLRDLAGIYGWDDGDWSLSVEERPDREWESLWRARWKPFRCGRLVLHPTFIDAKALPLRASDQPVSLVPGSSFGTGGHGSTRMALRCLQRWCASSPPAQLLDLGTGSGILAVCAAVLGSRRVAGMDPDPASAAQATATALANGVQDRCWFWRGVLDSTGVRWPAVMANLQSDLLVHSAGRVASFVAPGGRLFTGGILDRKLPRVVRALAGEGLKLRAKARSGRWCGLEWVRSVAN